MSDQGAQSASTVYQSSAAPGTTGDLIGDATHAVQDHAARLASAARDKAGEQVERHKGVATQTLTDFASAIRRAGDDLAQHDQSVAGRFVKQAADGLEGLSKSLSDKGPEELLHAARDFGRSNPAAFIAGSVLVGLALGRFVRSSGQAAPEASGVTASAPHPSFGGPAPALAIESASSVTSATGL